MQPQKFLLLILPSEFLYSILNIYLSCGGIRDATTVDVVHFTTLGNRIFNDGSNGSLGCKVNLDNVVLYARNCYNAVLIYGYANLGAVNLDAGLCKLHSTNLATYAQLGSCVAYNACALALTLSPAEVNGKVTHCLHTCYVTVLLPYSGKRRQNVDVSVCALQQHLGHTRAYSEVTVNLERSVAVEEVVIDTTLTLVGSVCCRVLQSILNDNVSVVAILSASPEVNLPTHRPSCCSVATMLQSINGGHKVLALGSNLVHWEQSHKVRNVAVASLTYAVG